MALILKRVKNGGGMQSTALQGAERKTPRRGPRVVPARPPRPAECLVQERHLAARRVEVVATRRERRLSPAEEGGREAEGERSILAELRWERLGEAHVTNARGRPSSKAGSEEDHP